MNNFYKILIFLSLFLIPSIAKSDVKTFYNNTEFKITVKLTDTNNKEYILIMSPGRKDTISFETSNIQSIEIKPDVSLILKSDDGINKKTNILIKEIKIKMDKGNISMS